MALKPLPVCGGALLAGAVLFAHIASADTPGSLDESFDPGNGANEEVMTVTLDPEGRVLLGGWFSSVNGTSSPGVARLLDDGAFDESFDVGVGANNVVDAVQVDSEGRLLLGGNFSRFGGDDRLRVARVQADGNLDTGFGFETATEGPNDEVLSMTETTTGQVLAAGWFTSVAGESFAGIARLNADGTLDADFNPAGNGTNQVVRAVLPGAGSNGGAEEKILIAGDFTQYNGTGRNRIALLNADGTLAGNDGDFSVGTGFNGPVYALAPGRNDRIYAAGNFTTYRSNTAPGARVVRILPDGERDDTFNPAAPNGIVYAVAEDAEGRVIIAGNFSEVGGEPRNRIARLLPGGALDDSFDPGAGPDDRINSVALQDDGNILIAGRFQNYGDPAVSRNRIARIFGGGELTQPESGYNIWVQENFTSAEQGDASISGPEADPDGDGVVNVLEYAFGGDPKIPFSATLPAADQVQDGDDAFLEIVFLRLNANDLVYRVQASNDMNEWSDIWVSTDHPFQGEGQTALETVRDAETIGAHDARFLRVTVSMEEVEPAEPGEPEPGYEAWGESYFTTTELEDPAISGRSADPDGDGVVNLLEYAFGGNPKVPNSASMPTTERVADGGDEFQEISFFRLNADDIVYRVQGSDDLVTWTDIWVSTDHPFAGTGSSTTETVRDTVPVSAGPRFLRVQVSEN